MAGKDIHRSWRLRRKPSIKPKHTKKSKSNLPSKQKIRTKTNPSSKTSACSPASDLDWESDEAGPEDEREAAKVRPKLKTESDVEKDPFADIEIKPEAHPRGLLCELHTYDARYNSKGEPVYLRTGSKSEGEFEVEKEKSMEAALVLTRYYSGQNLKSPSNTKLEVKSPHIQSALRNVIGKYPGVNIDTAERTFLSEQPRCLFHYREELRSYAMALESSEAREHILFSLRYMERYLQNEISTFNGMMNNKDRAIGLEFSNLWMAFRPGALLYLKIGDAEEIAQLKSMHMVNSKDTRRYWDLQLEGLIFNGKDLGRVKFPRKIEEYDGYKPLSDLITFPLQYHSEQERIRKELVERGKKYVALIGSHYRMYEGPAIFFPKERMRSFDKCEKVGPFKIARCVFITHTHRLNIES
jgi:hypothetical protein